MELHAPTVNRAELRVGSVAMLLGGVGAFVTNLFHPHPPNQTEALIRMLVAAPHWSQLHFLIMLSVAFSVCGLAMLTRNLADPMARALGTLGRYLVILGGSVYLVEVIRLSAIHENGSSLLIVPVVNHELHKVGSAASRNSAEEVARLRWENPQG